MIDLFLLSSFHTLGDVPYEVKRSFSQGQTDASTGGWDGESRLSYTVESDQYYRIGDKVSFQKKELTVVESTAELRDSEWIYHYKLYQESDLKLILITNSSVIGAALEGRILDVKGDKVRIHLNVDAEQGKEQACWLPYKSAYTAEGNSGFYCMPQTGDSVQLYMPSASEKEAVVISSVRKGGGSPKLSDPSVKYWGTSFGKELKLGGSELVLNGQENQLFIKLDTGEGITIESPKSIRLTSDKTMELAAEKRVELRAGETMYLLSGASSLVLDGETDIQEQV
ncbi:phage baseplate assembly protein V [Paenibacillus sp. NPDC058174]|uniref:phage baseplate assembly protein V n=1 Tax=Paenibacillus sp. NPDC058174 TaxID=3346366 RepID=UPI0036D81118